MPRSFANVFSLSGKQTGRRKQVDIDKHESRK